MEISEIVLNQHFGELVSLFGLLLLGGLVLSSGLKTGKVRVKGNYVQQEGHAVIVLLGHILGSRYCCIRIV